ncbi:hypothetical protein RUM44_001021 [Polyplax serrata]|uniref:Uncharacterized protein n=1 Tax=Polyplax serrata TaxID=468196 RepID=A0ABR1B6J4_POLSC
MGQKKTVALLAVVCAATAYPLAKEGKSDQNSLDYQVGPLLNYHLQQLLLAQAQQSSQDSKSVQPSQTQQYSVQPSQYSVQDQLQLQQQYQDQLQAQLALQLQAQLQQQDKAVQTSTEASQIGRLTVNPYQDAAAVYQQAALAHGASQYQQAPQFPAASLNQYRAAAQSQYEAAAAQITQSAAQDQQAPSTQQYQVPLPEQYSGVPTAQYTHQALQQYQMQKALQDPRKSLIGVAYSSAVDASKTQFSGYGIKYSF